MAEECLGLWGDALPVWRGDALVSALRAGQFACALRLLQAPGDMQCRCPLQVAVGCTQSGWGKPTDGQGRELVRLLRGQLGEVDGARGTALHIAATDDRSLDWVRWLTDDEQGITLLDCRDGEGRTTYDIATPSARCVLQAARERRDAPPRPHPPMPPAPAERTPSGSGGGAAAHEHTGAWAAGASVTESVRQGDADRGFNVVPPAEPPAAGGAGVDLGASLNPAGDRLHVSIALSAAVPATPPWITPPRAVAAGGADADDAPARQRWGQLLLDVEARTTELERLSGGASSRPPTWEVAAGAGGGAGAPPHVVAGRWSGDAVVAVRLPGAGGGAGAAASAAPRLEAHGSLPRWVGVWDGGSPTGVAAGLPAGDWRWLVFVAAPGPTPVPLQQTVESSLGGVLDWVHQALDAIVHLHGAGLLHGSVDHDSCWLSFTNARLVLGYPALAGAGSADGDVRAVGRLAVRLLARLVAVPTTESLPPGWQTTYEEAVALARGMAAGDMVLGAADARGQWRGVMRRAAPLPVLTRTLPAEGGVGALPVR
jgi:hypothetical protein